MNPYNAFDVASALVASQALREAEPEAAAPLLGPARAALANARVELYCDHEAAALRALREAREAMIGAGGAPVEAMGAVEEASWHIRHHHGNEAQIALQVARDILR